MTSGWRGGMGRLYGLVEQSLRSRRRGRWRQTATMVTALSFGGMARLWQGCGMIRSALFATALGLTLLAAPAFAQVEDDEIDSIVVTARASGAPMWEIETDQGTVVLVGVLRQVPKSAVWQPEALERATARSQRILGPQEAKVSFMDFLRVIWRARTLGQLPNNTTSDQYLSVEDQARLDALEAKYRTDWSRDSFLISSSQLLNDRLGVSKNTADDAEDVVRRAARRARIALTPVGEVRGDEIIENLLTLPPETQVPCMSAAIRAVEAGPDALTERGRNWTRYDVPAVMASPVEQALGLCWPWGDPTLGVELRGHWVQAIQTAVTQPGVTMAVAPLRVLAEEGGVLDLLAAQGLSIDGPEWKTDPTVPSDDEAWGEEP